MHCHTCISFLIFQNRITLNLALLASGDGGNDSKTKAFSFRKHSLAHSLDKLTSFKWHEETRAGAVGSKYFLLNIQICPPLDHCAINTFYIAINHNMRKSANWYLKAVFLKREARCPLSARFPTLPDLPTPYIGNVTARSTVTLLPYDYHQHCHDYLDSVWRLTASSSVGDCKGETGP